MGKIVTVTLPDIGEGVVEGEVVEWLKQEGDTLKQDEPVVVVMTDKATVELPAPHPGTLKKHYQNPGEVAKVNHPIYDIEVAETQVQQKQKKSVVSKEKKLLSKKTGGGTMATPATRQLAKELGVDIDKVTGTGKEGRVLDQDVVLFHAQPKTLLARHTPTLHMKDDEEIPIVGVPHMMAEKMVESKNVVPHFSFFDQLDATRLIQLRENIQPKAEKEGYQLTYMPFFIKALSNALKKHPHVNSSVELDVSKLNLHKHHNIGVASSTESGLIVFVLRDVQEKSLEQVIKEYNQMMTKMKEGKLDRNDMINSTITISNFGPLGGYWATPIINYPEVAILGVAKIRKEPVVKADRVVIRPRLNLSWSFDHRVIDGSLAATFSNTFISLLENPAQIL